MAKREEHRTDWEVQPEKRIRAAQYVRMSTDHQKYTTQNQADAIRQYADARAIDIVRTYADEGKSGLRPVCNLTESGFPRASKSDSMR